MSYRVQDSQIKGAKEIVISKCLWYTLSMIKDIQGFEGLYAITTDGKIWSYPRNRRHKSKKGLEFDVLYKGKWLTNKFNKKDGYFYIILSDKNHKEITQKVHRLVAMNFIPNTETKKEVNHKNAIKTDNRVENLEWVTRQENATHAAENGLLPSGEKHHNARLSDNDIFKIKELSTQGLSQTKIAKMFGVRQPHISRIITGVRRKTYGIYN